MEKSPHWVRAFFSFIFKYRLAVVLGFVLCILGSEFYLYLYRPWSLKDTVQVCAAVFIVLTIFFAALNYEFSHSKMNKDIVAAKKLLTFNTATEWHKPTMVQNMKISLKFAKKYAHLLRGSNAQKFHDEFEKEKNEDAKTAIVAIFNYFECIALAVDRELIDEEFVKGFFRSVFLRFYEEYFFYIDFRRKIRQNPNIWNNFTSLANKWKSQ